MRRSARSAGIHRLAARWGLSDGSSVERTERDLKRAFDRYRKIGGVSDTARAWADSMRAQVEQAHGGLTLDAVMMARRESSHQDQRNRAGQFEEKAFLRALQWNVCFECSCHRGISP